MGFGKYATAEGESKAAARARERQPSGEERHSRVLLRLQAQLNATAVEANKKDGSVQRVIARKEKLPSLYHGTRDFY